MKNKVWFLSIFLFSLVFIFPEFARAEGEVDTDKDGLFDYQEIYTYHTDVNNPDTDGDGYVDGEEVKNGFSPLVAGKKMEEVDTDSDGLSDHLELSLKTDLNNYDTDGDKVVDGEEARRGDDPLVVGASRGTVERKVEVDISSQKLFYFMNGIKLGEMYVSTGLPRTPTPKGEFQIQRKVPVLHYVGEDYNLPNTKWNLQFKKSYYLHGAYWHNQFGIRPMSHGCVNIAYKDVEKLYSFMDVGDKVYVYGNLPKGRLKKT
jgi:hypothetical protein